jgi:DnaJ family protein A protein 2
MDPQDLFSQLFGGGGGGGGFFGGGGGRPRGPRKGKDLVHRVKVTLEELFTGKVTKLALQKHILCSKCDGRGGKEGSVKSCHGCNGQGIKVVLRQLGPMVQQMQQTCPDCQGAGETIAAKDRCKQCNGKKITQERQVLEARVEIGMDDGQQIVFKEAADQAPNTIPGDVIIVVDEQPHPKFKRRKNDLITDVHIDLLTALGGGKVVIEHVGKHALSIDLPAGEIVKPGAIKVLRGQGMPSQRHHEMGDLYVNLHVDFPDEISIDKVPLLEQALPSRRTPLKIKKDMEVEDVQMTEVDEREARAARGANGAGGMEEDEEEAGGGPGVQCAQA